MDEKMNNTKMIKTDSKTIDTLSKIKGWHLIRGGNFSYSDIVRNLILKDAKKKGLIDKNGNENYQPNNSEEKKMELPEGGEERTQTEGGTKHESLDNSGRSPQKTQSDTVRLSNKQNQPQTVTTKRTPYQQRETQKEKIKDIGGEEPYEGRNKENRNI